MKATPTTEQMEALKRFAEVHGRTWKSQLNDMWMIAAYSGNPDAHLLQQVRNQFGPSWLVRFRFPKVEQIIEQEMER